MKPKIVAEAKRRQSLQTAQSLDEYEDRQKHKFYKDHFLLITRLFDNHVKAFINNILMANKDVEHYSYRIEFQVRAVLIGGPRSATQVKSFHAN